jgi:hypothetical protein
MIVGKFLHRSFSRGWGAGGWRSASEGLVGVRGQKPSCNCTAIDVAGGKKKHNNNNILIRWKVHVMFCTILFNLCICE